MKLWGGRFETGPSEVFERFGCSLHFDKKLIRADIQGSQAFARALERVGILTADERAALVAAFDSLLVESESAAFYEGATDEDVHTLVIRKLKDKVAALADKIHTGRSRNEQVSLDVRLWLRGEIDVALEGVRGFLESQTRSFENCVSVIIRCFQIFGVARKPTLGNWRQVKGRVRLHCLVSEKRDSPRRHVYPFVPSGSPAIIVNPDLLISHINDFRFKPLVYSITHIKPLTKLEFPPS